MNQEETQTNYTNYVDELTNDITKNINKNIIANVDETTIENIIIKIIENIRENISEIDWDKHFNRKCGEILKNGGICSANVKPGYDHCQRHVNIVLIKQLKKENPDLKISDLYKIKFR
jgi:hypothetical protein